jgi:hypothetical protein
VPIAQAPPPAPRLHPKLSQVYRATVANLHAALNVPEGGRDRAGVIERITVRDMAMVTELTGDIVKLLSLPGGSIPDPF